MNFVVTHPPAVERNKPSTATYDNDNQLLFPFAWPAAAHAKHADKHMVKRNDKWGEIIVHRSTELGIWVVSKWIPVTGPSGYIGSAMWHVFPDLFFTGREAHIFAVRLHQLSGPLIDCTMQ